MRLVYLDILLDEVARRMARTRAAHDRRPVREHVLAELVEGFEAPGADEQPIVCGLGDSPAALVERLR